MARGLLLLMVALLFVAGVLGLRTCGRRSLSLADRAPIPADITVLRNGMVVLTPDGTVARALVDWLDKPRDAGRTFHLGGVQFIGRSTIPTLETAKRVPALVKMLKAYPEVHAHFIGYTLATDDAAADEAVAAGRARWAVDALLTAGIDEGRLSGEGHRASRDVPPAQAERIDLRLERPGSD